MLVVAMIACGTELSKGHSGVNYPAQRLVGIWDASLTLTEPYPLALPEPIARKVCGTIGFVENHDARSGFDSDSAQNLGVFDLDLSRLGLNWLDDSSFPIAVAIGSREPQTSSTHPSDDSVTIVLNAGSRERIVLRGRYDIGGIDGRWTAQSARGDALGLFSLRPRLQMRGDRRDVKRSGTAGRRDASLICDDAATNRSDLQSRQ